MLRVSTCKTKGERVCLLTAAACTTRRVLSQSPVHPYGVEEYVVPADAEGHYARRLTLALHVARAYYAAAFSGGKEVSCAPSRMIGPWVLSAY